MSSALFFEDDAGLDQFGVAWLDCEVLVHQRVHERRVRFNVRFTEDLLIRSVSIRMYVSEEMLKDYWRV